MRRIAPRGRALRCGFLISTLLMSVAASTLALDQNAAWAAGGVASLCKLGTNFSITVVAVGGKTERKKFGKWSLMAFGRNWGH